MEKAFSNKWKSSSQPRKQIKFRKNAPLHTKRKFLSAHLSKDLMQKHKTRNLPLRKGDKVKVVRGTYTGTVGKIDHVNLNKERVFVEGTARTKSDGSQSLYPIHPSNVIIQELIMDDKRRKMIIERRGKNK